jgi:hypothetical protein
LGAGATGAVMLRNIERWALPWLIEFMVSLPWTLKRSLIVDRLLGYLEKK